MAKLLKREYRFSRAQRVISPKLKGFTRSQRDGQRLALAADARPRHGVPQPMPERK